MYQFNNRGKRAKKEKKNHTHLNRQKQPSKETTLSLEDNPNIVTHASTNINNEMYYISFIEINTIQKHNMISQEIYIIVTKSVYTISHSFCHALLFNLKEYQ